ncbi:MAG: ATP-dependent helicase HrpB [Gemmatimonadetes bacterium]|nr:ATP-dependent helicase HrpB [Gemmatimonadota bacterium]
MLPIEPLLPEIARALGAEGRLVLQAPPGAGKTTLVPLALLEAPWLAGRRILLLEPRRLAARAAARRMAHLHGDAVGGTVGYRIRREVVSGPRTRIEVVTEGILTRMLQSDPELAGVGLVIFDEFHERSLHADLGLALTLESRAVLRPDLRLLVMSATLDGQAVSALLGDAPILTSEGRGFPVETRYLPPRPEQRLEAGVAAAVRQALAESEGDLLVFLPGQGEIHRTAELLEDLAERRAPRVAVHLLHGMLAGEAQDAALLPAPAGTRKVVLATSIAETSLTIEGVRVVIDAGLARVPKYAPRTGMTRLTTVRVSRAAADQRRGRAGRTAPGVCYRLWAAAEEHHLLPRATPEILEADLAPLALELAASGSRADQLAWLDAPPAAALAEARGLLAQLGALDGEGRITAHGKRMAEFGTHPRLAHLLLRGHELGQGAVAARLAALLEERDLLRADRASGDADLALRLDLLDRRDVPPLVHGMSVDRGGLDRVRREARAWQDQLRRLPAPALPEPVSAGLLLALAYPDRIGMLRAGQAGRFLLANGQGAATTSPALVLAPFVVAADLDGDRRESRLWLGLPLAEEELRRHFGGLIRVEDVVRWEDASDGVVAVRRERLGALVLRETGLREPEPSLVAQEVLGWIRRAGLAVLPWTDDATRLRERLGFLHHHLAAEGWPAVDDAALLGALEAWLGPALPGVRRRGDLARVELADALLAWLGWQRRAALDQLAPTHLPVPTGSMIRVDYADPAAPVLAVRLQEVFGLTETPRVAGGRVPVTMHLLSPAHRPVQVTRDLAGFWRTSYFDVRKEMKGRYPRHAWPEDPLTATPTRRAKPRS